MASKVRRWAVRRDWGSNSDYIVFLGRKPRTSCRGWNSSQAGYLNYVCPEKYERFFPECYHLKPGGGPVEIEFKEA